MLSSGLGPSGNVAAAVNAYTAALEMEPGFVRCYANRAACYLQMLHFDACVADCTKVRDHTPLNTGGRDR